MLSSDVVFLLNQRRRRYAGINSTLNQHIAFSGKPHLPDSKARCSQSRGLRPREERALRGKMGSSCIDIAMHCYLPIHDASIHLTVSKYTIGKLWHWT